MLTQIGLLERCLAAWEDYWFLMEITGRAEERAAHKRRQSASFNPDGALANFRELRTFILKHAVPEDGVASPVSLDRFLPPKDCQDGVPPSVADLPLLLFGWCSASRRVYQMTAELQLVLTATSLHKMRWEDVSLPFPAFAVQLEKPFKDPEGDEFSLVFLYSVSTSSGMIWRMQSLSNRSAEYVPLSAAERSLMIRNSYDGRVDAVQKFVDKQIAKLRCVGGYSFSLGADERRELVQRTIHDLAAKHMLGAGAVLAFEQMMRTVVGLTLYLRALPPRSQHLSEWTKCGCNGPLTGPHLKNSPDRSVISSGAEVCTVSSIYTLTTEERELLERGEVFAEDPSRTCPTHFRSGHWRRRRGQGHDPYAPKVEQVRWTIVRRDRIPESGGLPQGTLQITGEMTPRLLEKMRSLSTGQP